MKMRPLCLAVHIRFACFSFPSLLHLFYLFSLLFEDSLSSLVWPGTHSNHSVQPLKCWILGMTHHVQFYMPILHAYLLMLLRSFLLI